MVVASVNVGKATPIPVGNQMLLSGIFKTPVAGAVQLNTHGFELDEQADMQHHGGPDQAVYIYTRDDYAFWEERLQTPLPDGQFGENLTLAHTSNVLQAANRPDGAHVGDRFIIGDVTLEVTAPRIPCAKLASKMNDPGFPKQFLDAGKPGYYTRVIHSGSVRAGDKVVFEAYEAPSVAVSEIVSFYKDKLPDVVRVRLALTTPLAARFRQYLASRLEALEASA